MTDLERLIADLREEQEWQGECFRNGTPYTNCVGYLERAADTLSQMADVLAECRLIVANLPHDEDMLLRKIDVALGVSNGR